MVDQPRPADDEFEPVQADRAAWHLPSAPNRSRIRRAGTARRRWTSRPSSMAPPRTSCVGAPNNYRPRCGDEPRRRPAPRPDRHELVRLPGSSCCRFLKPFEQTSSRARSKDRDHFSSGDSGDETSVSSPCRLAASSPWVTAVGCTSLASARPTRARSRPVGAPRPIVAIPTLLTRLPGCMEPAAATAGSSPSLVSGVCPARPGTSRTLPRWVIPRPAISSARHRRFEGNSTTSTASAAPACRARSSPG